MKYVYVCPKCGSIYNVGASSGQTCSECGVDAVYSGYTSDEFERQAPADKRGIINNIMNEWIEAKPPKGRFWIQLVNILTNIFVVLHIILSVIVGVALGIDRRGDLGFIVAFFGVFGTLISAAVIKIFLGVAEDVRDIRNSLADKR